MVIMKKRAQAWFRELRGKLIDMIENHDTGSFYEKKWDHSGEGGGLMSVLEGSIIEKGGVNISTVSGEFSETMQKRIPGAEKDPSYWATGISVVLHPKNPNIPSMHFNTRFLSTTQSWFGGGMDITPCLEFDTEKKEFHKSLRSMCDKHNLDYYPKYKKWCDDYFFLKHRNEPRGIGGIFFDYLNSDNQDADFLYVKDVGIFFENYVNKIISSHKKMSWTESDKERQLIKRGRYVEFNLLYDRGTKFGLETGGNTEAILMSLPPLAKWK
tara:strand:+ start:8933 stop:9739 length:807 start_codon:yes stop_codon:yes gene_type:complete